MNDILLITAHIIKVQRESIEDNREVLPDYGTPYNVPGGRDDLLAEEVCRFWSVNVIPLKRTPVTQMEGRRMLGKCFRNPLKSSKSRKSKSHVMQLESSGECLLRCKICSVSFEEHRNLTSHEKRDS